MGESVMIHEELSGWAKVSCPDQPYFGEEGWSGYPGWVPREALLPKTYEPNSFVHVTHATLFDYTLSLGSRLYTEPVDSTHCRIHLPDGRTELQPNEWFLPAPSVSDTARTFLGSPYLWGGRSSHQSGARRSVDCSALVQLVYAAHGKRLPRNARDQYRSCRPVQEIQIGDLLFLAHQSDPSSIHHVMLYAGENLLIEATADSGTVREITLSQKLKTTNLFIGRP
jgi:hypothetical protein